MLGMSATGPIARWRPCCQRCRFLSVLACCFHPAAKPFSFLLVRWVADDNRDRLLAFDLVCFLTRFRNWRQDAGNPLLIVVWISESVSDEHAHRRFRYCFGQVKDFGRNA